MIGTNTIRRHGQIGILLVPLLLCFPTLSQATFMETLGIGARAQAMGSAYTAVADDLSAIYYNPAGLAQIEQNAITVGYLHSNPTLRVSSSHPDHPGFRAQRIIPYRLNTPYVALAFNMDKTLKGIIPLHVRIGVLNAIPDNFKSVYSSWDPTPSTPRWVHFGDYWDRVHLQGAFSLQLDKVPWIALGMGFRFIISGKSYLMDRHDVYGLHLILQDLTPVARPDGGLHLEGKVRADGNFDMDVNIRMTPTAGLMLFPTDRLRVGYSFRNRVRLALDPVIAQAMVSLEGSDEVVWDIVRITLDRKADAYYMPQQHNWGVSYRFLDNLLVAADLSWFRWSAYKHIVRDAPLPRWRDTLNPRVGVEYNPIGSLALRLGYTFQPSPIPDQVGESNYIDNDKHVFSLGAGYTFRDPTNTIRLPFRVNLMFQYLKMFTRETTKGLDESGNPYPPVSFKSSGDALSVGGDVTLYF